MDLWQSTSFAPVKSALGATARRLRNLAGRMHRTVWRRRRRLFAGTSVNHRSLPERLPLLQLYASADNVQRAAAVQTSPGVDGVPPHETLPGLSVCILNLDKAELILALLHQLKTVEAPLFARHGMLFQIVVGDTGSQDQAVLRGYKGLGAPHHVCRGLRYQFSKCNNTLAWRYARGQTLLFLNNDVALNQAPGALWRLYEALHKDPASSVGIVGSCLFYPDGRLQHGGMDFLRDSARRGLCYHPHAKARLDPSGLPPSWATPAVTGACLMIKRALYNQLGGMDELYEAECQDVALCLRAAMLGYGCRVLHAGHVVHLENATRRRGEENWPDRQRLLRHFGAWIEAHYL